MWIKSVLSSWTARLNRTSSSRPRSSKRLTRLSMEPLEDRLTPSMSMLAAFSTSAPSSSPESPLVMDSSGNLYGTTKLGGAFNDGTLFEIASGSGKITTLASFNGTNGAYPVGNLVMDASGNLYGAAELGGAGHSGTPTNSNFGNGTIFELAKGSGTITALASFNGLNGEMPMGGLVMDGSGNLYGTTEYGGAAYTGVLTGDGGVFELARGSSTIDRLASFNGANGEHPQAGLVMDGSGNLYGTASAGGANGYGTVFEVTAGAITTLASFSSTNRGPWASGLAIDGNGNLYGTTYGFVESGLDWVSINYGTVFEVAAGSGTMTTLASFNGTNGANPDASLIVDGSGNLYGTTEGGGKFSDGAIFELAHGSDSITDLAAFTGSNGIFGLHPSTSLFRDGNGNLYGTTATGSTSNDGTVYELGQGSNSITPLASFNSDGEEPEGGVIMDANGNLYGTTYLGGAFNDGTVYEIAAGSGVITTLASFDGADGANPRASLFMDASGNLYGTTYGGGASSDGTVFEIAAGSGVITTLASFNRTDGALPDSPLLMDGSGNLYGTTYEGGASGDGTVYEVAQGSSAITTLSSFNGADGEYPMGSLVMDSNGNLYGTTENGGASSQGTVFEVAQGSGTITTLVSFDGADGQYPIGGLLADGSGNLYGTTEEGGVSNLGTVFELAPSTGTIATLASFNGVDGSAPLAGLVMDGKGNLYGTTLSGGAGYGTVSDGETYEGRGTVFELAKGSNSITTLASFTQSYYEPLYGSLVMDKSGNLYGTTSASGAAGWGSVYEVQAPADFLVSNYPASTTAGAAHTFTVTAQNFNGTTDTGYTGTVQFASSDPRAVLPANFTFTAADNGVYTFTATLETAGSQSITVTDISAGTTGSETGISVLPAAATKFILSAPASVTHSVAFTLTLTVEDAYGNVVTGYTGTVHFSSSDSTATLPANYTFTAADAGEHTFTDLTTLRKKGKQTISATDTVDAALSVTDTITVD